MKKVKGKRDAGYRKRDEETMRSWQGNSGRSQTADIVEHRAWWCLCGFFGPAFAPTTKSSNSLFTSKLEHFLLFVAVSALLLERLDGQLCCLCKLLYVCTRIHTHKRKTVDFHVDTCCG